MNASAPAAPRKLPLVDALTAGFWTGGADGQLLIQRCAACDRYQHPPQPICGACHKDAVTPVAVSGRGRVKTYTVNHQRWLPGSDDPYVFAAVELVEQAELYVFSNILAPPDTVRGGMPVRVVFERQDDVWLPLFEPDADTGQTRR